MLARGCGDGTAGITLTRAVHRPYRVGVTSAVGESGIGVGVCHEGGGGGGGAFSSAVMRICSLNDY